MTRIEQRGRPGFAWAAPALTFFGVYALIPIVGVAYLSFTQWDGLGGSQWVGLDNWKALPNDLKVWNGIRTSLILTALSWVGQSAFALLLGVWAAGRQRNRAVLSALFFLPLLLSSAAIALLWLALLDPNFGLAASLGQLLGVGSVNVLGNQSLALYAVTFVILWQFMPFHMLLYQAATRQIPGTLYDAATVDGAGRVRQFFSITLPQLRDTIIASSVLILVGSLVYFENVLLLTGGGPGTATRVLPLHMYIEGFRAFDMGYASAIAVLLVVIGAGLSLLVVKASGYSRMASQREGL